MAKFKKNPIQEDISKIEAIEVVGALVVEKDEQYTLIPQVKRLEINGVIYPREKIVTDEKLMNGLIAVKSPFIKKI